ncbi:MAG TPA: glutathione S-transferase family protein [Phenylobacterium sp.]|jgi:glutathione S-transferase|uniref:glutathione S-transferase family protein n=1 Tax=Phenylobacterium sp. TaxID=1871053 RepID=UPI002BF956A7|nr:glutathione S-transferase family protein [Phenylobacterium sp.]HXA40606.1 glutathione S-transferase family protein [Phenylobacterium sp.]
MSDPIVVHGIPGSPYVRKPLLVCEEKGAPYRLAAMAFGAAAHKAPEHLARNPFGRIPTIEHGDFVLYESQAIGRYIDQVFDGPSLTPADPRAQARMNQVMNIVDWYVMPSITSGIGFNRVVKPKFGMEPDEQKVADSLPLARTCVAALEDILAAKPYFAGEAVSLADLFAYGHFEFLAQTPEGADMLAGSPLLGWMERMAARPSVQNTSWERLEETAAA